MTFLAKTGSFNTGTGAVASTVAITGLGFTPKAIMFWWSRSTTTGSTDAAGSATIEMGVGFASGASNRNCTVTNSLDNNASSKCRSLFKTDACVVVTNVDGDTVDGLLDFTSFDADGFTLTVDDQFTASFHISYLALGGTDITDAYVGSAACPSGTGNAAITAPGFKPNVFLGWTVAQAVAGTISFFGGLGFGAATGSSQRGVVASYQSHSEADSKVAGYGYNGEVLAAARSWGEAIDVRADFVSFDTNGFTLNWLETDSTYTYGYLVIKGGKWLVGDLTTRTDGNDIVETGFGFTPAFGLFSSHCAAMNTQDTLAGDAQLSIGAFDSVSSRVAHGVIDVDAQATMKTALGVEHDQVYVNMSTSDAVEGLMDIKSVDSNGFTTVMDDTDPVASWVWYLAGGPFPTLTAAQGSYSLTGQAVILTRQRKTSAVQGSYAITGQAVGLKRQLVMSAAQGSYGLTGQAVTLKRQLVTAVQGSYVISGQSVGLTRQLKVTAVQGSYVLAGQAILFSRTYVLAAVQGSYVLSGQAVGLYRAVIMSLVQGSYAVSGQSILFSHAYTLAAVQGAYVLSGQVVGLYRAVTVALAQGSYTVTGAEVDLAFGYYVGAVQGAYTLGGHTVSMTRQITLIATQGTYALTGQTAAITRALLSALAQGAYVLNGQTVELYRALMTVLSQGSYAINGQPVELTRQLKITAALGSYALNGQTLMFTRVYMLAAVQGAYSVTGQSMALTRAMIIDLAHGVYTLTGQSVALSHNYSINLTQGVYIYTGQSTAMLLYKFLHVVTSEALFNNISSSEEVVTDADVSQTAVYSVTTREA